MNPASRVGKASLVAAVIVVVASMWCFTAWLSRDVRPWAIEWSGVAFAVCLGATYAGLWLVGIVLSQNRRTVLLHCLTTTAVLLIVVAILEVGAFAGFVNYDLVFRRLRGEGMAPAVQFVEDSDFGYRRPPRMNWSGTPPGDIAQQWNLPTRYPHEIRFTTDSKGFRNRRDLDTADIVLIGDSYVEGHNVSDDETTAAFLEESTGLSVANLGQSGYGTLQESEILQRFGLPLRPKLVAWFFFEGNDLYDDEEFENMMLYMREHGTFETEKRERNWWESRWKTFTKASFTRNGYRQLRRMVHSAFPIGISTFGWFTDGAGDRIRLYFGDYALLEFTEFEQGRLNKTGETLLAAKQACDRDGIRFVVLFVPMKFRIYGEFCAYPAYSPCRTWTPWDLNERMAAFCRDAGIDFVDLSGPMIEAAGAGRLIYAAEDSHWNVQGHRFVAEQLARKWNEQTSAASGGREDR